MSRSILISLHIGAHKTASTHLQHTLYKNRELLLSDKIALLGPRELRKPGQGLHRRFPMSGEVNADGRSAQEELEFVAGPNRRVIISEENILGTVYAHDAQPHLPLYPKADDAVARLVTSLSTNPISVFLAVRDPASFFASAYCQGVMAGNLRSFGAYAKGLDPREVKWSNLLERLRRVAGIGSIFVWRYEDYPANTTHICRRLVRWRTGPKIERIEGLVHAGLSTPAMEQIVERARAGATGDYAKEARDAFPLNEGHAPYAPWKDHVYAESAAAYARDIERISAMEGVTVL